LMYSMTMSSSLCGGGGDRHLVRRG
jgi:hypothetical protein